MSKIVLRNRIAMTLWGAVAVFPLELTAKDIPIDAVPEKVLAAVREAVGEFELLKAEREWEWRRFVYELSGVSRSDGIFYEIEVTAGGKVLEIEKREDLDEDDDDDG